MHFNKSFYFYVENTRYWVEIEGNTEDDVSTEIYNLNIYDTNEEPLELDHPHYETIKFNLLRRIDTITKEQDCWD